VLSLGKNSSILFKGEIGMKDREYACWIVGGVLCFVGLLVNGIGYWEAKIVALKTEAWVGVAHEIMKAVASLTD
jgi:hypothetical protein